MHHLADTDVVAERELWCFAVLVPVKRLNLRG